MGQTWVTLQCIATSAGACSTWGFNPIRLVPNSPWWSPPVTCLYARFCLKYNVLLSVVSLHRIGYYPSSRCSTCNNSLAPLLINKGSRTALNHGRIQQQCSDRQCHETHFYNIARMIHGSSPLWSSRDQPPLHSHPTNSVTQPPMLVALSQLPAATQRPQDGIYCLNLNCNPQVQCHQQGNSKYCEKLCCSCCLRTADTLKDCVRCPVRTRSPSDSWSNGIHAPLPNSPSACLPLAGSILTNV